MHASKAKSLIWLLGYLVDTMKVVGSSTSPSGSAVRDNCGRIISVRKGKETFRDVLSVS